jgi:hypothetical protein
MIPEPTPLRVTRITALPLPLRPGEIKKILLFFSTPRVHAIQENQSAGGGSAYAQRREA